MGKQEDPSILPTGNLWWDGNSFQVLLTPRASDIFCMGCHPGVGVDFGEWAFSKGFLVQFPRLFSGMSFNPLQMIQTAKFEKELTFCITAEKYPVFSGLT